MKRIITYGTFDLIHYGHIELLRRAKSLGNELIVGLSTDEFNKLKNKETIYPYQQRKKILQAIKYVDHIIPEFSWNQKIEDVKKYEIDTFVIGDDWKGEFDFLKAYCKVLYLPRTKGISTSEVKKILLKGNYSTLDET